MNTALAIAVLNALWQGVALVALTALAMRVWTRRNAATTCAVWTAVYFIVALLPLADVVLVQRLDAGAPATVRQWAAVKVSAPARAVGAPLDSGEPAGEAAAPPTTVTFQVAPPRARDVLRSLGTGASVFANVAALPLFAVWALVASLLLARLVTGYRAVLRIKRVAHPLSDPRIGARIAAARPRRTPAIATSDFVSVPCAVGFFHPMILLPAPLADTLDADDLARVVLHELAHLQRRDDWLNALQRVIGALFFFQPALAYAGRRIDLAREMACDDSVLESTGEPIRYAECLTKIVERRVRGHLAAVPGFVFGRGQVVQRVRTIVERRGTFSSRIARSAGAAAVAAAFAAFAIARVQVPVVAQSAEAPAALVSAQPAARARLPAPAPASRRAPAARAVPAAPPQRAAAFVVADARNAATLRPDRPKVARARTSPARPATAAKAVRVPHVFVAPLPAVAPIDVHFKPIVVESSIADVHRAVADEARANVQRLLAVRVDEQAAASPAPAVVLGSPSPMTEELRKRLDAMRKGIGEGIGIGIVTPKVYTLQRVDMLDAIDAGGYGHPSVDELIALRNAGVDGSYIKAMGALRPSKPSLHDLIALRNQGITAEFVAASERHFGPNVSVADVIGLRNQGVTSLYLNALSEIGYTSLGVHDVLALANQGVSSRYIRDIAAAGYRNLSPAQLIALHNQGVGGTYLRRLADHGYRNIPVDKIIELKASGFEP